MKKKYLTLAMLIGICLITGCGDQKIPESEEQKISSEIKGSDIEKEEKTSGTATNSSQDEEYKKVAKACMENIKSGNYDKMKADFQYDANMKKVMDDGSLETSLKQVTGAFGEFKKIGEPFTISSNHTTVVSVPCEFENQNINFNFTFNSKGEIAGILTAKYQEQEAEAQLPEEVEEREVSLSISGGRTLPGTLTLPKKEGTYPAVILVHGSGSNDRNETIGQNAPFRDIAWGLAQQGIAVYRYDKRNLIYGKESIEDLDFTVNDETVDDAIAAAEMVKTLQNIDPNKVFVLGHSLGGEMIPRIAEKADGAGYILLAASSRRIDQAMEEQIEFLLGLSGLPQKQKEAIEKQKEEVDQLIQQLSDLDALQPEETLLGGTHPAYWKDLLSYEPVKEAENIQKPVLVLQGEEDYQVTMEEDYQQWKDQFSDHPNWTFKTYPDLTHLFIKGKKENGGMDYTDPQKVDAQVIEDIAEFVFHQ